MKRLTMFSGTLAVLLAVTFAVAQQYPIMDKIANKVVMKYQQSSCEELMQKERIERRPALRNSAQFSYSEMIRKCARPSLTE